jgi:hypothetical protein
MIHRRRKLFQGQLTVRMARHEQSSISRERNTFHSLRASDTFSKGVAALLFGFGDRGHKRLLHSFYRNN